MIDRPLVTLPGSIRLMEGALPVKGATISQFSVQGTLVTVDAVHAGSTAKSHVFVSTQ